MALEYVLYTSADLTVEEFLSFTASIVGAEILGDYARHDALDITPYREDPGEEAPVAEILGFTNRLTVTYRLSNRATPEAHDEATVAMTRSVLAFLDRYPAAGALLHNDSRIILQRVDGPVVLDSAWEDWTDVPGVNELVAGLDSRPLPQPLL